MPERLLRMTYDLDAGAAYIYVSDPIRPGEAAQTPRSTATSTPRRRMSI
jgi:hypothetical protein